MIISGSTDKTVKVYQLVGDKYDMIADVNFFDDYILAVAINRFGEGTTTLQSIVSLPYSILLPIIRFS